MRQASHANRHQPPVGLCQITVMKDSQGPRAMTADLANTGLSHHRCGSNAHLLDRTATPSRLLLDA